MTKACLLCSQYALYSQGYGPVSDGISDQGYSTPGYSTGYPMPDPNFMLSQKLDSILSECMEQKQMLGEALNINKELKDELFHLKTEVAELKDHLESGTAKNHTKPRKIPLDLSVSSFVAHP